MKFKINNTTDPGTGQWQVNIDGEEWQNYLNKGEARLKENLSLPGFRKGKVPQNLLKQKINDREILIAAHRIAAHDAFNFAMKQKTSEKPFSQPKIGIKILNNKEYAILIDFHLTPSFKITKYTGFTNIAKPVIKVDKSEVDATIVQLRKKFAMLSEKKGTAIAGDEVNIDFKGFINKEAFKNGSGKDFNLELGSGQFIPGFEDQLIGSKAGDDKTVNVKFPSEYPHPKLAGQDAVFHVHINKVSTKKIPPVNDELIKDLNDPRIKTIADLSKTIKLDIKNQKEKTARDNFMEKLLAEIAQNSSLVVPDNLIYKEMKQLKQTFINELSKKNLDLKKYKKTSGIKDSEIEEELKEDALIRIQNTIILEHVLKEEKLVPTPSDIEAEYKKMASQFNVPVKDLKQMVKEENLIQQISSNKVFDFLYKNNGAPLPSKAKTAKPSSKTSGSKPATSTTTKTKKVVKTDK